MKNSFSRLYKLQSMMIDELVRLKQTKPEQQCESFEKLHKKAVKSARSICITLGKMESVCSHVSRDLVKVDSSKVVNRIVKMPQCFGPTESSVSFRECPFVETTADNFGMAKKYLDGKVYDSGISFDEWLAKEQAVKDGDAE